MQEQPLRFPSLERSSLLLLLLAMMVLIQLSTPINSHALDMNMNMDEPMMIQTTTTATTSSSTSNGEPTLVVERPKEAFWSLITNNSSMEMTVNITLYLGGINGNSSTNVNCGHSMENPCVAFTQLFYSLNETLYRDYSDFLNMKSVERNVLLKVIVIGNEPFLCGLEWYQMEEFELVRFFMEITHLDGRSSVLTCVQTLPLFSKGLLIPYGFEALYLHDLVLNDIIIFDLFISVLVENCYFNGSGIMDNNTPGQVESNLKSRYFIVENSFFSETIVVNYRNKVVVNRSTLDLVSVFYLCDEVIILDSIAKTLVNIQESSIVHVERTIFSVVHTFACNYVTFTNCETSDINQSTKLKGVLQKFGGIILSILAQSGTSIIVKDIRVYSGKLFSSVTSFQNAIFENITMTGNAIPSQDLVSAFLIFKEIVYTTLRNIKLDNRFAHVRVESYSVLSVVNCEFSQRRQFDIYDISGNGYRSQVLFSNSKFYNSYDSAVTIQSVQRLFIDYCEFYNNLATFSGAAVRVKYLAANLFIRGSKFINNRVTCNLYPMSRYGAFCGGGAISIESAVNDAKFTPPYEFNGVNFIGNYADRGGAIYFPTGSYQLNFQYSQFVNNTARLSGGAMFFNQATLPTLSGCTLNGNVAVMGMDNTIPLRLSSAEFTGITPKIVNGNYELLIGERYNISFIVKTTKDGTIAPFSDEIFDFYSSSSYIKLSNKQPNNMNYITFTINVFGNETLDEYFKVPTRIIIENRFSTIELPIQIGNCKSGTALDKSLTQEANVFNFECKKIPEFPVETYVAIIIGTSLFLFILGILLGLGMYCMVTIIKKLNRLKKKERAEQAIENKLIDKRMLFEFTEEEQQYYDKASSIDNGSSGGSTKYRSLTNDTELSQSLVKSNSKTSKYQKDDSFIIPIEEITIEKRIGEGGSANVFLGSWSNINVAIKSLKYDFSEGSINNEEFEKEAAVLSRLRHPNVLIFYGVCMTEKSKYIVTEYMENGALDRFISNSKYSNFTNQHFQNVLKILLHISNGMIYLHSLKPAIIHRDLKPGNVLLNDKNQAKVSDFGLVKLVSNTVQTNMTKQIGTILYCSPETFVSDTQIENKEASKIDVYSFAIIMWEMFFRATPFQHVKNTFKVPPLVINGQRPLLPFDVSNRDEINQWITTNTQLFTNDDTIECVQLFINLMTECWKHNPSERPSFNKIYELLENIVERI
ncbi:predicted protein [Naegleria gruberi]|uniref:Predicted protein n=1 Tax=Naegleria gruberi TaxID=5762 RepID=D2VUJ7_NAEGR|nr:uncharacterized protein NAEGRDRAFT_72687 [Naegleria gruberi]EFC39522.1 predicted protein [Naegleria gruberi]|eukprot:XP_002672266.1 predicted protein [Naegleria gruberi strain NEG-M]